MRKIHKISTTCEFDYHHAFKVWIEAMQANPFLKFEMFEAGFQYEDYDSDNYRAIKDAVISDINIEGNLISMQLSCDLHTDDNDPDVESAAISLLGLKIKYRNY